MKKKIDLKKFDEINGYNEEMKKMTEERDRLKKELKEIAKDEKTNEYINNIDGYQDDIKDYKEKTENKLASVEQRIEECKTNRTKMVESLKEILDIINKSEIQLTKDDEKEFLDEIDFKLQEKKDENANAIKEKEDEINKVEDEIKKLIDEMKTDTSKVQEIREKQKEIKKLEKGKSDLEAIGVNLENCKNDFVDVKKQALNAMSGQITSTGTKEFKFVGAFKDVEKKIKLPVYTPPAMPKSKHEPKNETKNIYIGKDIRIKNNETGVYNKIKFKRKDFEKEIMLLPIDLREEIQERIANKELDKETVYAILKSYSLEEVNNIDEYITMDAAKRRAVRQFIEGYNINSEKYVSINANVEEMTKVPKWRFMKKEEIQSRKQIIDKMEKDYDKLVNIYKDGTSQPINKASKFQDFRHQLKVSSEKLIGPKAKAKIKNTGKTIQNVALKAGKGAKGKISNFVNKTIDRVNKMTEFGNDGR